MGLKAAAFLWGLAEATLFFIVPDVLLSAAALRDRKRALWLCLWSLGGALVGGLIMYLWGSHDLAQAERALVAVPAIGEQMIERVGNDLDRIGALSVFLGPLTGTPYKIYAALAPAAGISLLAFLAISVPARLLRFVLITLLVSFVSERFLDAWTLRKRMALLLSSWTLFYAGYFLLMPWS